MICRRLLIEETIFCLTESDLLAFLSVDRLVRMSVSVLAIRKKFEQAANGNRAEFDERFAFLIESESQVGDICQNGYQCAETSFNVLGKRTFEIGSNDIRSPMDLFSSFGLLLVHLALA